MVRKLITIAVLGFGVGMILCYSTSSSQTALASQSVNKTAVAEGRKLFQRYCVSCHGVEAKGNGPVAPTLKKTPADLTNIKKVDGKFPGVQVQQHIAGEVDVPSHGTREMPVWGTVLRHTKGAGFAKMDIYNLTKYIESIQGK